MNCAFEWRIAGGLWNKKARQHINLKHVDDVLLLLLWNVGRGRKSFSITEKNSIPHREIGGMGVVDVGNALWGTD